jgi:hypothetical protein
MLLRADGLQDGADSVEVHHPVDRQPHRLRDWIDGDQFCKAGPTNGQGSMVLLIRALTESNSRTERGKACVDDLHS